MGKTILIAASGTGGHLFPALYIARALLKEDPSLSIHFVGAGRPLEEKIITEFPRHVIKIVGVNRRGIKGLLQFISLLPKAAINCWRLLTELKPAVVVGVGGYASVLPVTLARIRGIPTWIHEAELSPGLANKFLGYLVTKASVAFPTAKMPRPSCVVPTGHPVREGLDVEPIAPNTPLNRLLITGGSQGAESIDSAMLSLTDFIKVKGISVYHQARPQNVEKLSEHYRTSGVSATVVPFIEDLAGAYRNAQVVISRSGAGSIMELGVVNRPAILVPFPSKGIGQLGNAKVLEDQGKAIVVEEGAEFVSRLRLALEKIFTPDVFFTMQANPCRERSLNAAEQIAKGILGLS